MKDKPTVSIICLTYNHASYIRECLDGFLMQQTDFPYEVIIHDDASTDGTTEIIKEYATKYPDIIKPIIQTENQYSKHRDFGIIINNCIKHSTAQYIAFCEGDDYWINDQKLQKQVKFLDENQDYGMCYTQVKNFIQKDKKFDKIWGGDYEDFSSLLRENTIPTLSVLCRAKSYFSYFETRLQNAGKLMMEDYPMWLYFASHSKIKFLNEVTGIYRQLPTSASHTQDILSSISFGENYRFIAYCYANLYGNCNDITIAKNNLAWIRFIKHSFLKEYKITKEIAKSYLFSKQNSIIKNIFFLIGCIFPKSISCLYTKR